MDFDIVKLSELLSPKRLDQSDSEDEIDEKKNNKGPSPGDIGVRKPSVYAKEEIPKESKKPDAVNPENEAELYLTDSEAAADWKKTPKWDVSYKQQVTPSDVFLQMSGKTSGTASCEDLIVKIHLPEEDNRNIDLKVTKEHITLVSPKYRLKVPLPHPVDPKQGNAKWDKDSEQLIVTLRMDREFDFINF